MRQLKSDLDPPMHPAPHIRTTKRDRGRTNDEATVARGRWIGRTPLVSSVASRASSARREWEPPPKGPACDEKSVVSTRTMALGCASGGAIVQQHLVHYHAIEKNKIKLERQKRLTNDSIWRTPNLPRLLFFLLIPVLPLPRLLLLLPF